MPTIDNANVVINSVILTDQGSAPTTPPTGKTRIYTKSDGLYVVDDAGSVTGPLAGASTVDYILIREEQTSGTNAGTFTAGAWRTRTLNAEVSDVGGHASIGSNQITLAAGTYRYYITVPATQVDGHQARLYDITVGAIVTNGEGSTEYARQATGYGYSRSVIAGKFTIAGSNVFEVQHYCTTTVANYGMGAANGFGIKEVYTICEFWKEA